MPPLDDLPPDWELPHASQPASRHRSFAMAVAREMRAQGQSSAGARVIQHLLAHPVETDESVAALERLAQAPGWQTALVMLPQLHALPAGLAAGRGHVRSLAVLLARHARTQWPAEHPLDDPERLTGREGAAYEGVCPSPLVEAVRGAHAAATDEEALRCLACMEMLERRGASPFLADPAIGRSPAEEALRGLEASGLDKAASLREAWVAAWKRWASKSPDLRWMLENDQLTGEWQTLEEEGLAGLLRAHLAQSRLGAVLTPVEAPPSARRPRL